MEISVPGAVQDFEPRRLPEATLRRLEEHAVLQSFAYGQRIPYGGPLGARIHYIRSGRVRVTLHGPDGQDKILAILDSGAVIGDVDVVRLTRPTASYHAAELTETWSWPRDFVLEVLREESAVAVCLVASLARKVKLLTAQIQALAFYDAAERVIRTFVHLAHIYGEADGQGRARISIRLTQSDIGQIANASRVTVNKVFKRLKADELMSKRAGYFIVHDLGRLSARVDPLRRRGPEPGAAGASGQGASRRIAHDGHDGA